MKSPLWLFEGRPPFFGSLGLPFTIVAVVCRLEVGFGVGPVEVGVGSRVGSRVGSLFAAHVVFEVACG